MRLISLKEIEGRLDLKAALKLQEDGFVAYSQGRVSSPPVGELEILNPKSHYHVKYAHKADEEFWVLKVAGGPSGKPMSGVMMAFDITTGKPFIVIEDEGYLTNLRTALAGAIAAKYLGPKTIDSIGVLGTGVQARLQVEALKDQYTCRKVFVWGRKPENRERYRHDLGSQGYDVTACNSPGEVAENANLIITTTPSEKPLLNASDIKEGTHITAVGADAPGKQELDVDILTKADILCADSRSQCLDHGELSSAFSKGIIQQNDPVELGEVILEAEKRRQNDSQITVADLTGLGVQDSMIVKSVIQ